MAAFVYKHNMDANAGRMLREYTMTDAQVLSVGEAVKFSSGKLVTAGAGGNFLGVIAGFVKADGAPLTDDGAGDDYDGTYTAPTSNTVKAQVDVSPTSVYSVTVDATLGTTTGSDLAGYNMDMVAASNQLDESSSATTVAQWFSLGQDPDASAADNSVLVKMQESEMDLK